MVTKPVSNTFGGYVEESKLSDFLLKANSQLGWKTGLGLYHFQEDRDGNFIRQSIEQLISAVNPWSCLWNNYLKILIL